jgi:hypothetical protein
MLTQSSWQVLPDHLAGRASLFAAGTAIFERRDLIGLQGQSETYVWLLGGLS